ncbi:MAG: flavodoxin-dependent (E)-4-hydroxy-3-methylbut-2-enyl-diphosphate synthase [Ruminococcaceae bacterium]|nr:flavodoxin-dependent (E)-4-hydroxy-3-methylbut-2-enyl-diphosphate synthase [Oscillospiraceae bacterium]
MERRISRTINVGGTPIGGTSPISVQSMTNVPAEDFDGTARQVIALENAGCDIVRIAVPKEEYAEVFRAVRAAGATVPLVADIHFDYKIALAALKAGADKIRINPGNIGAEWKVREVAAACKVKGVPIRIGVNGGSLDKAILEKYGSPTAAALAESALTQAEQLESMGFCDTVISIKSSRITTMTEAARIVAKSSSYPIHLGVTEAGTEYSGIIKNSIGIGSLLCDGIGDTLRVSLTADPVREVLAGKEILKSLDLCEGGINIISCPTCGRTKIDLIGLAEKFREESASIDTKGKKVTVAVMGCVVNGPGEAKEADFGIAGGDGFAVLFKNGETLGRVEEDRVVETLIEETLKFIG